VDRQGELSGSSGGVRYSLASFGGKVELQDVFWAGESETLVSHLPCRESASVCTPSSQLSSLLLSGGCLRPPRYLHGSHTARWNPLVFSSPIQTAHAPTADFSSLGSTHPAMSGSSEITPACCLSSASRRRWLLISSTRLRPEGLIAGVLPWAGSVRGGGRRPRAPHRHGF
jgi:hypothetical protein